MTAAKPNPAIRLFPSLTDVAFLMPIAFVFLMKEGASGMLEGDTGWHIRTGEWILEHGRVPQADIFSFTRPGEPWFAWEWLWDVGFAWLHRLGGLPLVAMASLVAICLTFAFLFRLVRRRCANPLIAGAVTLLAAAVSSMHWLARPHLFTLLFVVIFLSLLERVHEGKLYLLWVLPPLTVIWTNLHGGFVAGILVIGCYGAGELIAAALETEASQRSVFLRRGGKYLLATAGCVFASLVNPYSYRLHGHILRSVADPDSPLVRFVNEWQSPTFHHPASRYLELLMVLAVAAAIWSARQRRYADSLLLIGWMHLSLVSARNVPIFAIAAAPAVAQAAGQILLLAREAGVPGWLRRAAATLEETGAEFAEMDNIGRVHLISAAGALLVVLSCWASHPPEKLRAAYSPKKYPVGAVERLPGGKIFASDEWGDYLIYRLYPAGKVFIDGRVDFYGARFAETYLRLMEAKHDWEHTLNRYDIGTVVLPVEAPLVGVIKESERWRPVYDDGAAIVFGRWNTASIVATEPDSPLLASAGETRDLGITNAINHTSEPRL